MRKGQLKGFISGIIVATLIFALGIPALAATVRQLNANYSDIKITLDGKAVEPKDANGVTVEPFSVDGTIYLPLRPMANALGLDVTWDGTTQTAKLNHASVEPKSDGDAKLPELPEVVTFGAGVYVAGVDIALGKYTATATAGSGNFYVQNNKRAVLKANEVFGIDGPPLYVAKIKDLDLESGDQIGISHDLKVTFTPTSASTPTPTTVPSPTPEPKPTTVPTPTPKPEPPDESNQTPTVGNVVYVTKTGKKYHYSSTCNGGTYTSSTLSKALSRGLTPCSKCVD